MVAEEWSDQDGNNDAHGQQNEQSREAGSRQTNTVDDFFTNFPLENRHARNFALVRRISVQRESQIDGRNDFVTDFDANVSAANVAFVKDVRSSQSALDTFFPVENFVFTDILDMNDPTW